MAKNRPASVPPNSIQIMKPGPFKLSITIALTATLLLLAVPPARADVEDKIAKSFPIQPGGQLVVQLDRGAIEVGTADINSVDIEIVRKAGGRRATAEKTLTNHVVTTTLTGSTVEVRGEYKGEKSSGGKKRSPELQVTCRITVPRQFNVNLKTAGG